MNLTVSVIIPTYNVEAYIKETIQSVLNQTYQNFEIIIVDDCSTDGTVNVIKQFQDTRINLFLNEKNSGPSYSRNKAINLAKGEWIAILDSDDWWDRARLEKMIQMGQDYNVNIVCDDMYFILDGETRPLKTKFSESNWDINNPTLISIQQLIDYDFGILQPIFQKEFIIQNNLKYRENLGYSEDFILMIECMLNNAEVIVLTEPLYYYRLRKGSLSTKRIDLYYPTIDTLVKFLDHTYCKENKDAKLAIEKRIKQMEDSILYYQLIKSIKEINIKKTFECLFKNKRNTKILFSKLTKVMSSKLYK